MKDEHPPVYLLPLALGNFAGPLLLGRFFDSIGRRKIRSVIGGEAGWWRRRRSRG